MTTRFLLRPQAALQIFTPRSHGAVSWFNRNTANRNTRENDEVTFLRREARRHRLHDTTANMLYAAIAIAAGSNPTGSRAVNKKHKRSAAAAAS
ncbi:hypothetical protein EYF80_042040 [Liparis tanakae]|uniref:Uncharacterized protein n=1 Tax=Liparis tanakae TaxID=230148 RepID=A0A4Z2G2N2_9TELE|nr:hypothetical protein EYF80_042040 [Liparis tanakae]